LGAKRAESRIIRTGKDGNKKKAQQTEKTKGRVHISKRARIDGLCHVSGGEIKMRRGLNGEERSEGKNRKGKTGNPKTVGCVPGEK